MFIVECLPFSKGLNRDFLSYFSSTYLEPGSLIKVNLRGKNVNALVFQCFEAREVKSELKSANFQIKKVISFAAKPFLKKEFLGAVKETAEYFAASPGSVLSQIIPTFVIEHTSLLASNKGRPKKEILLGGNLRIDPIAATQSDDEERYANYRLLVREEFARGRSVFLCLPQNEGILQAKKMLERGIESYVACFYKDMSKKEFKEEWKKARLNDHPVVIIATARWLFIPRDDLGTIIVDKENESGWKTLARPFIDLRYFAEALSAKLNIRIVFGDMFLRIETLERYKEGKLNEFENIKWREPKNIDISVIDQRKTTKEEKEWKPVSKELLSLIEESVSSGSHMFIFAARKGVSSIVICRDCGEEVRCGNCASPMTLYRKNKGEQLGGMFRCHQCGETRDANEYCQNCKSWKLAAYGVGIDLLEETLTKALPKMKLLVLHKDSAPTGTKAAKIVAEFYETKGSVLLGTEMAFPYLSKKVSYSCLASFDSLFSIPDFRIREKIFRIIMQTRNIAKNKFLIQTRSPEDPVIEHAISGNISEFYNREIDERKSLAYPPFSIFIKVTARGTKSFVTKETENLKKLLADYSPAIFQSIHEKKGEVAAVNAVIKLGKDEWPKTSLEDSGGANYGLFEAIKSLPPHFEIKVDPDNLL